MGGVGGGSYGHSVYFLLNLAANLNLFCTHTHICLSGPKATLLSRRLRATENVAPQRQTSQKQKVPSRPRSFRTHCSARGEPTTEHRVATSAQRGSGRAECLPGAGCWPGRPLVGAAPQAGALLFPPTRLSQLPHLRGGPRPPPQTDLWHLGSITVSTAQGLKPQRCARRFRGRRETHAHKHTCERI